MTNIFIVRKCDHCPREVEGRTNSVGPVTCLACKAKHQKEYNLEKQAKLSEEVEKHRKK